jgi:hypothetical protein
MRWQVAVGTLLAITASTELCLAADPRYPDWPCAQARYRRFRSQRCGPVRRSTMPRTNGRTIFRTDPTNVMTFLRRARREGCAIAIMLKRIQSRKRLTRS